MNLTFKELLCPNHREDYPTLLSSHGGQFGGITSVTKRCNYCGLVLLIIPMKEGLEYSIKATTEEQRREELIKKAKEEAEKALHEKIELIKTYKL